MATGFFRECSNPECRFRYPDQDIRHETGYCPICGERANIASIVDPEIQPNHKMRKCAQIIPFLDNLRSVYNVGSIIRTCEGFGVSDIILAGITPSPTHPRMNKTGLGSIPLINWQSVKNGFDRILEFKAFGFQIVSLENVSDAIPITRVDKQMLMIQICLVVGNENLGIDPDILKISDLVVAIPMLGKKESFNVSVAFGIAAYHLSNISKT